jgi:flagellar hook-basal body complex protein FliE
MTITPIGLNPLETTSLVQPAVKTNEAKSAGGIDFSQMLENLSQTENNSNELISKLAAGEDVDIHQVMIASDQTDISFRVALAIRDQLVNTYREVMRMAV